MSKINFKVNHPFNIYVVAYFRLEFLLQSCHYLISESERMINGIFLNPLCFYLLLLSAT